MSDVSFDPQGSRQRGSDFASRLYSSYGNYRAGNQLAQGNVQGAANTLYRTGNIEGGRGVVNQAATERTAAETARTASSTRQLQTTQQIVKALKAQRDAGQDISAALPQYRETFLAMGTRPEDYDAIAAQIAANPAFLDQIEAITAQQMEYELRAGANGDTVAVGLNPQTGQTTSNVAYQAPREPKRVAVGNDYIEVGEDGAVTPLYQGARAPEYRSVRNSDGTEAIVEVGGRPGGVIGGGASAPAGGGAAVPRGIRNNNPGNIEDGAFARSLPGYVGSDGRFAIFDDPSSGEAAQTRLLGSYVQRGFDTPTEIINRWAPPSDNNPTGAYINYVAQRAGIGPNDRVTEDKIPLIAQAIREFENGSRGSSASPSAASAGGGARVVAQGQNLGLSPSEQRAQDSAARTEARGDRTAQSTLRREFNSRPEVKEFREVDNSYRTIQNFVQRPSAAGDISLIFAFMKVLDPTSTVREGEFATASNAGGIPESVRNMANRALNGQRLQPRQRQDFLTQAGAIRQSRQSRYNEVVGEYRYEAEQQGFDPNRIVGGNGGTGASGGNQRRPQTNTGVVPFDLSPQQLETWRALGRSGGDASRPRGDRLNPIPLNPAPNASARSWQNIPSGAYFIHPDGTTRRKP